MDENLRGAMLSGPAGDPGSDVSLGRLRRVGSLPTNAFPAQVGAAPRDISLLPGVGAQPATTLKLRDLEVWGSPELSVGECWQALGALGTVT